MVWGRIAGLGRQSVVTLAKETTAKSGSTMPKTAERFLKNTGDTLLGVRGNIAVVQNKAPFNGNLLTTSFYDITKSGKDAWLKTK